MKEYLSNLWTSLFSTSGELIPRLIGALIILIVGLLVASLIKRITKRIVTASGIDAKLNKHSETKFSIASIISKLAYYLAMIFVLTVVLAHLGITGALTPLENMLNEFLTQLPNLFAAGLIGFVGYYIAKILSELVGLIEPNINSLSEKVGLTDKLNLAGLLKQLVFLIIFIPILFQALNYLNMEVISEPATAMISEMWTAVPNILVAAIVLSVFYIAGKYAISVLVELLKNIGTDNLLDKAGLTDFIGEHRSPTSLIGNIAFFFIMFIGTIAAVEKLGFVELVDILNNLLLLSGHIFFGLVILIIGNNLSQMVSAYVAKSESSALASIVRFATLGLFVAIALRQMGIANDIVNVAFMLILGAVAVAIALAYGLGGREAAGEHFRDIINKLRK